MNAQRTPGTWSIDERGDIVSGPLNVAILYATKPADKALMAAAPMLLEGAIDAVAALKLLRIGLAGERAAVAVCDAHIAELEHAIARATQLAPNGDEV